jgi:hypothetical protein
MITTRIDLRMADTSADLFGMENMTTGLRVKKNAKLRSSKEVEIFGFNKDDGDL